MRSKRALTTALLLAAAMGVCAQAQGDVLAQANAALAAGEADKALTLLEPVLGTNASDAQAHNLACRVRLILDQFDAAHRECEEAVRLDPDNSNNHLWLGRVLGEKADRASFMSAYSLAKRVKAEFEEAIRLDPRNAEALASMGEFDTDAPGVVGGGLDKAEAVAVQLEKVDAARAWELNGHIADERKDYDAAEHAFKTAIQAGAHPANQWMALASFYRRRERWSEMVAAVRSGMNAALHDHQAAVALYNGASSLERANRELPLAVKMLKEYVASPDKTEEAPAFVAYNRLARLEDQLGDTEAAGRDRAAALTLAHDYSPQQAKRH